MPDTPGALLHEVDQEASQAGFLTVGPGPDQLLEVTDGHPCEARSADGLGHTAWAAGDIPASALLPAEVPNG
jgi:hypothetical protein